MRDDQARRYESEWQRRVVFEAEGSALKVVLGQACWPKKIMGRLLRSLDAWEKEYGIESVPISPAESLDDPSTGHIWVKGHPARVASAEEGLRAIIGRLFPDAVFGLDASIAAEGACRGHAGADPEGGRVGGARADVVRRCSKPTAMRQGWGCQERIPRWGASPPLEAPGCPLAAQRLGRWWG